MWQAVIYLAAQVRESLSKKEATSDDFTITLRRKAKPVKLLKEEGENQTDPAGKNCYRDLLRLLSKVDRKTMEEAKRRYPEMAEAWMEIFAPEIREREIRAAVEKLADYISLEEAIQHVATKYDKSVDDVKKILVKKEPVAV